MAEPVGVTLGALGVMGLLSVCLDCFNVVQDGLSLGKDFVLIEGQFSALKIRLYAWAHALGFTSENGYDKRLDNPIWKQHVQRQLNSISLLFLDADKITKKYDNPERIEVSTQLVGPRRAELHPRSQFVDDGLQAFLVRIRQTKKKAGIFGRFTWALVDKKRFAELTHRLKECIEALELVSKNLDLFETSRSVVQNEVNAISDIETLESMITTPPGSASVDAVSDAASQRILQLRTSPEQSFSQQQSSGGTGTFMTAPTHVSVLSTLNNLPKGEEKWEEEDIFLDEKAWWLSLNAADRSLLSRTASGVLKECPIHGLVRVQHDLDSAFAHAMDSILVSRFRGEHLDGIENDLTEALSPLRQLPNSSFRSVDINVLLGGALFGVATWPNSTSFTWRALRASFATIAYQPNMSAICAFLQEIPDPTPNLDPPLDAYRDRFAYKPREMVVKALQSLQPEELQSMDNTALYKTAIATLSGKQIADVRYRLLGHYMIYISNHFYKVASRQMLFHLASKKRLKEHQVRILESLRSMGQEHPTLAFHLDERGWGMILAPLKNRDEAHLAVGQLQSFSSAAGPALPTYRRLLRDLQRLGGIPYATARWASSASNLFEIRASFEGAPQSPYRGGLFHLRLTYTAEYPYQPPSARFLTPIYHPNINRSGEICMDTLMDGWLPHMTLETILISIISLLSDPDADDPLVPEIATTFVQDRALYEQNAKLYTQKFAGKAQDIPDLGVTPDVFTTGNLG